METIKECETLCQDAKFISVLNEARGQVGAEIRAASSGAGYDRIRANRSMGLVISRNGKGGYKYSRVGTNVMNANECNSNNGLICNFIAIKNDPDAVAVLVGAPPNVRLESFNSVHFMNTYKRLSLRSERPVFVMGTGTNAIGTFHVTDGDTVTRVR
tara:strand:+ start:652 stop:1122 length:471 start_codon:yes stop_codon:yes gene_type:complete